MCREGAWVELAVKVTHKGLARSWAHGIFCVQRGKSLETKKIYIVNSNVHTIPGKIIKTRAAMKIRNRHHGDAYPHVSLSMNEKLDNMLSFARRGMHNPFNAGIVREDIRKAMFVKKPDKSQIAVMELTVTKEQYDAIEKQVAEYWRRRKDLRYNFSGLMVMLLVARGKTSSNPNRFFCSQWLASVLKDSGVDLFPGKKAHNVKPSDFYDALGDNLIYEGLAVNYPLY